MIIIGHPWIEFEPFYMIETIEDISMTAPNSCVIFSFCEKNIPLCEHCKKNDLSFALLCHKKEDILFAQALGCDFIVCDKSLVKEAQLFADGYLFDAKILLRSDDENDLLWAANHQIDGILFEKGVKYGSR